jgi:hypothetical protein
MLHTAAWIAACFMLWHCQRFQGDDLQLDYVFEKKTYKRQEIHVVLPLQRRVVETRSIMSGCVIWRHVISTSYADMQRVVKSRVIWRYK